MIGQLKAPVSLHPRKYVLVLIELETGWATESVWTFRRRENSLFLVVCFLLGNSPASEFCIPTLRNTVISIFMEMEQTECSETSAYKIQTLGNYPEGSIQLSEHDEILKSRSLFLAGNRIPDSPARSTVTL